MKHTKEKGSKYYVCLIVIFFFFSFYHLSTVHIVLAEEPSGVEFKKEQIPKQLNIKKNRSLNS